MKKLGEGKSVKYVLREIDAFWNDLMTNRNKIA